MHGRVIRLLAIAFVGFQLYTAGFGLLPLLEQRAIHVGFAVILSLLTVQTLKGDKEKRKPLIWDIVLAGLVIVSVINVITHAYDYLTYMGEFSTFEFILGTITVIIVLETARRTQGWVFPIITLLMMLYALAGPYFPGKWGHSGMAFPVLMKTLYQGDLGMWGYITGISATVLASFLIFGAFMQFTGGGDTFIKLGNIIAGRLRGGPALVSVIASGLFGMISGSAVANVATTGNLTIPTMKRLGYKPEFAGAVESVASMGGQFTPPIMGATAFIMAELLGISYLKICLAAFIPAILFYACVFTSILSQAGKQNLEPLSKEEIPKVREVVTWARLGPFIVPIGTLICFLLVGFTLWRAGFWAVIAACVTYFFIDFSWTGMKERLVHMEHALEAGAFTMAKLVPLLVCANMVVSLLGQTGLGIKLAGAIMGIAQYNVLVSLILASVVTIILGMGMPTTAAYIIGVTIAGTGLIRLGLDALAVHMFSQYLACVSSITPPVCLTVFTAAGIAGASWRKIAFIAMKLGIVAYIIPFLFIYLPELLFQGEMSAIVINFVLSLAAVFLLAISLTGWLIQRLWVVSRILLFAAGIIILFPAFSVYLGIPLIIAGVAMQWLHQFYGKRKERELGRELAE